MEVDKIAGVMLEKVWNERKSYALFALDFEARARAIRDKGYSVIYFSDSVSVNLPSVLHIYTSTYTSIIIYSFFSVLIRVLAV